MILYHAAAPIVLFARLGLALVFSPRLGHRAFDPRRLDLAAELRPFIACAEPARYMDDDELWTTIHKYGGLGALWRAVGEINAEAERRHLSDSGMKDLRTRILLIGWQIQVCVVLCRLENRWYKMAPNFPRIAVWALARLYCEMVSTLEAMPSPEKNLVLSGNSWH